MNVKIILWGIVVSLLAGCATTTYAPTPQTRMPGAYHEITKGDTLWKISKSYGISLEEIVKANRIPDANKIEIGQLIFIPEQPTKAGANKKIAVSHGENFVWPIKGKVISYFGDTKDLVTNNGIDIETQFGSKVAASRSGQVVFASEKVKGYGKMVIIDHGDGFQTVYAHNSENLTEVGKIVKQNEIIAAVGTSGATDKSVLHFEIRKDNETQNPLHYLP